MVEEEAIHDIRWRKLIEQMERIANAFERIAEVSEKLLSKYES